MRVGLLSFFLIAASAANSQVLINEICATNGDVRLDTDFGNFSSWIELYNPTGSAKNVSGFFLSDDPNLPNKWQIPENTSIAANGYLIVWCDEKSTGLHTNFGLSAGGESVILRTSAGAQIDRIDFPQQYTNISYGRTTDGATILKYSATPSPGTGNSNNLEGLPLAQPTFSKVSGRYPGTISVSISHATTGVDIWYTIDGSEPTATSTKYSSAVSIPSTRVLKAKAFHANQLPSEATTATYLIKEHTASLPIVSISTKPAYLWDNTIGIYTDGTNGITGNCHDTNVNWNRDWDRHAVFEYLSPTGSSLVNQHVDIRIGGACSRNMPQKSFVINPKNKYGDNDIDYAFFATKSKVDKFGGLFLRNAGNDFNTTMFRDAFIQSLGLGQMDLDYMAYQPTVFYLNGEYWGIQNLREKIDGDFIKANYGIDKDDVDLLETWENAIEGDNGAWVSYKSTLATLNPSAPSTFDFIDSHIDVQEYINYLVTEIYVCNTDWPGNNIKFWRQRSTNSKFRWILWDTDFGFGLYQGQSYPTHATLDFATATNGPGWPNPPFSTEHIRLVLQNPEFKKRFIATLATAMGTTFNPDRINAKINEFSNRISAEVPYHKQRWGGSTVDWQNELQRLRDFSAQRHAFMQTYAATFFGVSPLKFSVSTSPANSGTVKLNGVTTPPFTNSPYYSSIPYRIQAQPKPGFRFTGWTVTTNDSQGINLVNTGSSWKYFDQGTLPGATWTSNVFNDAGWAQGNAQLGYEDGDETTVVSYGPDAGNKYITTYFRKTFSITDLTNLSDINASVLFDDGAVVYLNGVEVYRNNMPAGTIANNTTALAVSAENAVATFTIDKSFLNSGSNVFAVEIHQSSGGSSDISFDFSASLTKLGSASTYSLSELEVYDTAYSDVSMVAHFEPTSSINGLVLNEISAAKSFAKDDEGEAEDWIELFNAGSQSINLAGLMLTDDLTQKDKHVINKDVPWLLQPGQYQILWADEQPEQGQDHLTFKLSADGENIGVYQMAGFVENVIAEFDFDPMSEGYSFARLPNATGPFKLTSTLTPGAANVEGNEPEPDPEPDFWMFPNPTSQFLNIYAPEENTSVVIFDLMGRKVSNFLMDNNQTASLDIGHLTDGVYLVKLISAAGEKKSRLIVASR